MDNPKQSPRILSICTGYGGLEKGIESILGKCTGLAYVEIEAFAIANLVNKMETGKMDPVPIWTDLKTFDAKPFRNRVDILTGGYPCQPFSLAGKGKAEEDPRHLWPFIRAIILHARPKQVFLENVLGHLSRGVAEVLKDLEEMGYRVEAGIFSAVEVGATHQRKRVFILANSDDMRKPQQERVFQEFWRRSINSGQELGNSESDNKWGLSESSMHRKKKPPRGPSCNVANDHRSGFDPRGKYPGRKEGSTINQCSQGKLSCAGNERLQKCWGPGQLSGAQEITCSTATGSCNQWPAPRGCAQWKWEEPRTLDNTSYRRHSDENQKIQSGREPVIESNENCKTISNTELSGTASDRSNGGMGRLGQPISRREGTQGKTKSKLGVSVDGSINRVDRLRLLGNGVVWQTAAKAYLTLSRKLNIN